LNAFPTQAETVYNPDFGRVLRPSEGRAIEFIVPSLFEIDPPATDCRPLCFALGVNLFIKEEA